jgi:hypothetical protein
MLPYCPPTEGRPRRLGSRPLLRAIAALVFAAALGPARAGLPYELGQGYPLPWLGLTAGGYATLRVGNLDGEPAKAVVKDLSLFLHTDLSPRWHFFTELELGDPLAWSRDGLTTSDAELDVERLYLDHNLTPSAALRLGKFLTPVGRWNLIHADPLVWSIMRPLTTSAAFARHASGIAVLGTLPLADASLDYQVYADDSNALDIYPAYEPTYLEAPVTPNPDNIFDHGAGLRLQYRALDDALQIGLSAAHFTLTEQPGTRDLVGTDLFYTHAGLELTSEAVYRRGPGTNGDVWGAFAQIVVPLGHQFFAVVSGERYKGAGYAETTDIGHLALAYRPTPPLSFKLELQESRGVDQLAPDGWQLSVSVLF